jgi:indole-3-glycerol phosphate synthase
MATYLDRIIDWHRDRAKRDGLCGARLDTVRAAAITASASRVESGQARSFSSALREPGLAASLDPAEVAQQYAQGGAACLSVLTDEPHFGGSVADLQAARQAVRIPVLRKDFTVCPGDVYEAAVMGADCVLLIVAALSDDELAACAAAASEVNLDVLWETHDEGEVHRALAHHPSVIGVNQRDLHTFQVDQQRAVRVAAAIPSTVVRVAESGVRGPHDAAVLWAAGYDAVLVGESIVTSGDRSVAVKALREVSQ